MLRRIRNDDKEANSERRHKGSTTQVTITWRIQGDLLSLCRTVRPSATLQQHVCSVGMPQHSTILWIAPARRKLPFFFFNDTATTEIYTLSLHDALPISV